MSIKNDGHYFPETGACCTDGLNVTLTTELKNRGLNDILIACVDGLKGFPDAINAVYPEARIQLCIVHMVRNSLRFVSWKDYKAVTRDLKAIYQGSVWISKIIVR